MSLEMYELIFSAGPSRDRRGRVIRVPFAKRQSCHAAAAPEVVANKSGSIEKFVKIMAPSRSVPPRASRPKTNRSRRRRRARISQPSGSRKKKKKRKKRDGISNPRTRGRGRESPGYSVRRRRLSIDHRSYAAIYTETRDTRRVILIVLQHLICPHRLQYTCAHLHCRSSRSAYYYYLSMPSITPSVNSESRGEIEINRRRFSILQWFANFFDP